MERSLWQKALAGSILPSLFLVLLLFVPAAHAGGIGGEPGAYLRPPMGAVAVGLAGAYTARADYYPAWWNPAAVGFLREKRLAGGGGMRSLGRVDGYGSFDFPIPPRVGMGLLVLYRGDPSLKLYGIDERLLPSAAYTTMTFKGAVGYYVSRKVSAGASISGLYQSLPSYGGNDGIDNVSVTGIGAIDVAASYRMSNTWNFALVVKNLGADMEWQMGDMAPMVSDRPLPCVIVAGCHHTVIAEKPFIWSFDCRGYAFDGGWNRLERPELNVSAGAEWRRWDNFFVRGGIGDISLYRDLYGDPGRYRNEAAFQVAAGFSYDMVKVRQGLWLNYGIATDKVWAGIDQQLDVTLTF
ncbi:MAG: hypothetical protein JXA71_20410 [Chitinispirillaceae bacterium]|nr:hypothetical protein [Chitinispirillaceae bacterium]